MRSRERLKKTTISYQKDVSASKGSAKPLWGWKNDFRLTLDEVVVEEGGSLAILRGATGNGGPDCTKR